MENKLAVFNSGDFTARTVTDDDGTIWVVAKDVAQSLGYPESSIKQMANLLAPVPEIWKGLKQIMTPGGEQNMTCLTEQGLYFFLGRSDKKAALPYQIWVAGEVVPSIREHGIYMTPDKAEEIIANPDFIIRLAQELKAEKARVKELTEKVETDKPKIIFADAVNTSKDSILIGNLAKLLRQNGIDIGQTRLFEWLRNNGYLCSCKGERRNMPTQKSADMGLFDVKKVVINNPDGSTKITHTTKVTGKGQIYFINGFLDGSLTL